MFLERVIIFCICQASAKIFKVEEKLAKGWGGENAYHVKGYRYLLVDGDRNISRASPPGKVTTLTKVRVDLFLPFCCFLHADYR